MVRLMIVDDHEVVRMGLRAALDVEPDFTVVAEAANGREARSEGARTADIVVDGRADGGHGWHRGVPRGARRVAGDEGADHSRRSPRRKRWWRRCSPARRYVLKSIARARLLEALRAIVAADESLLDSKVTKGLLEKLMAARAAPDDDGELTAREREVLVLIADGATNKEDRGEARRERQHRPQPRQPHPLEARLLPPLEAAAYAVKKGMVRRTSSAAKHWKKKNRRLTPQNEEVNRQQGVMRGGLRLAGVGGVAARSYLCGGPALLPGGRGAALSGCGSSISP